MSELTTQAGIILKPARFNTSFIGFKKDLFKKTVTGLLLLSVCGCTWVNQLPWWRDRSLDYQAAELKPALQVPEALRATTRIPLSQAQTTLKIPVLTAENNASTTKSFIPTSAYPVPRTEVLIKSQFGNALQLHNYQQQLWIEAQLSVDDLSKLAQRFWQQQSYLTPDSVISGSLSAGSVEAKSTQVLWQSNWVKAKWLPIKTGFWAGTRKLFTWFSPWVRYQAQLTPRQGGYALRIVEQQSDSRSAAAFVPTELDTKAIKRSNFITDQLFAAFSVGEVTTQSVVSTAPVQVELIKDGNDYPVLVIEQNFVQAWELLGESLQRLHVRVEDLNRSTGVYYVKLKSNTIKLPEAPLVLRVSRNQKGTQVTLEQDDETLPPKAAAEQLLQALHKDLQAKSSQSD